MNSVRSEGAVVLKLGKLQYTLKTNSLMQESYLGFDY